jgi:hypothetical protein
MSKNGTRLAVKIFIFNEILDKKNFLAKKAVCSRRFIAFSLVFFIFHLKMAVEKS